MKLSNCTRCGKLFTSTGGSLCPDCSRMERDDFEAVRLYLKEHPKASVVEVSQATGVSTTKIMMYVRQGRLVLADPRVEDGIVCMGCGEPIPAGRLCSKCAQRLRRQFVIQERPAVAEPVRKEPLLGGGRVHIADLHRRRRSED